MGIEVIPTEGIQLFCDSLRSGLELPTSVEASTRLPLVSVGRGLGQRETKQISRKDSHRNILRCPFIKMCVTVLCGLLHCCLAVSVFPGTAAVASALEPTWGSLQVVRGLWLPPMAM